MIDLPGSEDRCQNVAYIAIIDGSKILQTRETYFMT